MTQKLKTDAERLAWFELASHLHIPVEELKERITNSEFLEWQEYFEIKKERDEKEHYYLAMIALEVRRSYVKDPNKEKLANFLIRPAKEAPTNGMTPQERARFSKSTWLGALGIKNPEDN